MGSVDQGPLLCELEQGVADGPTPDPEALGEVDLAQRLPRRQLIGKHLVTQLIDDLLAYRSDRTAA